MNISLAVSATLLHVSCLDNSLHILGSSLDGTSSHIFTTVPSDYDTSHSAAVAVLKDSKNEKFQNTKVSQNDVQAFEFLRTLNQARW